MSMRIQILIYFKYNKSGYLILNDKLIFFTGTVIFPAFYFNHKLL